MGTGTADFDGPTLTFSGLDAGDAENTPDPSPEDIGDTNVDSERLCRSGETAPGEADCRPAAAAAANNTLRGTVTESPNDDSVAWCVTGSAMLARVGLCCAGDNGARKWPETADRLVRSPWWRGVGEPTACDCECDGVT